MGIQGTGKFDMEIASKQKGREGGGGGAGGMVRRFS